VKYAASAAENSPAVQLERAQLEGLLAECIDRIPKTERTVLSLYFYEELTLKEIAEMMDVHLSRVSQIKSQAVLRLRAAIGKRWPGVRS
jgi:RNA polymerase sigma factor for flagellar operon FliA